MWSHALTGRLSSVLSASHSFGSSEVRMAGAEVVSRTSSRAEGPRVTLALTYGLGAGER